MYFRTKNTLKINQYHTPKHNLNSWVIGLLPQFKLINFIKETFFFLLIFFLILSGLNVDQIQLVQLNFQLKKEEEEEENMK